MKIKILFLEIDKIQNIINGNKNTVYKKLINKVDDNIFKDLIKDIKCIDEREIDDDLYKLIKSNCKREEYYILNIISIEEIYKDRYIDLNKYILLVRDL